MGGEPGILDVVTGEKKCQEPKKTVSRYLIFR